MTAEVYHRYHIPTAPAPDAADHPSRFVVRVDRLKLASLLLRELVHYRADLGVVLSRPCLYGVFSGPVGGFAPRSKMCVGCLRCTVQYPDMVRVLPNPARRRLGDSYFTPDAVDTVLYEASTGRVPVRGAGYRGPFAGDGWDGLWTDMSEIVRPTRDGIHGREFISTAVDLGWRPDFLQWDESGRVVGDVPRLVRLPIPYLFDVMPPSLESRELYDVLAAAAARLDGLAFVPLAWAVGATSLGGQSVAPVVRPHEIDRAAGSGLNPRVAALDGWEPEAYRGLTELWPGALIAVRHGFDLDPVEMVRHGVPILHLVADYHGRAGDRFVADALREAHDRLVRDGTRERVTILVSGGLTSAEHAPKAILCGADAVALDLPLAVALQAVFEGECRARERTALRLGRFDHAWGVQRIVNLIGSWRDQVLEVLGAMGLREIRRLRGEVGRMMLAAELEQEAFAGIEGFGGVP